MKISSIKNIGGAILGLLLFCGIMLVSSTPAQAQYPTWNQDQYRREQRERERQAQIERERQARQQQNGWYDQYGNYHPYNNSTQNGWYDQYGNWIPNPNCATPPQNYNNAPPQNYQAPPQNYYNQNQPSQQYNPY